MRLPAIAAWLLVGVPVVAQPLLAQPSMAQPSVAQSRTVQSHAVQSHAAQPAVAQPPVRAAPVRGVGLLDLLRDALRDNPDLNSAQATRDAAHIDVVNAYIGLGPRANWVFDTANDQLDVKRSKNDVYRVGLSNFNTYANTLEVVQPLFDPRLFAQLHGAYAGLHRSRAELDAVRQKTVFELIQAYLIALGSADALALSRADQASLDKQNEMMEVRIARGLANQSDADELTARLMQARAQTQAASATVTESFATLEHRATVPVDALLPLTGPIAMPPPTPARCRNGWTRRAAATPRCWR